MQLQSQRRNAGFRAAAFLLTSAAAAAFFHLRHHNVPDPDSFYHVRHAALYVTNGIFMTEFPWIAWSAISRYASDIWYGFHLLLIPFTPIEDAGLRIKVPGIVLTCSLLLSVRVVATRHGLAIRSFWPFLLLFSAPNVLLHFTMTRPHVVTIALCALLFSLLVDGRAVHVFLVSLVLAFLHLSLFWMVPAIVVAVLSAKARSEGAMEWRKGAAAIAGILAGWLLRPNPIGAARLVRVQIVDLMREKLGGVPLLVGTELLPITGGVLATYFIPFLLLWVGAIALGVLAFARGSAARLDPRTKTLLGSTFLLSAGFFTLTLLVARRSFAPWTLFGVIFIASVYTRFVERGDAQPEGKDGTASAARKPLSDSGKDQGPRLGDGARRMLVAAGAVLFAIMVVHAVVRNARHLENAYDPNEFREAAGWLEAHSSAGEIVYNVHWDTFPKLFLWDAKNRYVSGMDPIFQYAVDPSLYYKSFYIQIGKATSFTCGVPVCTKETLEDTHTVLRRDFRASWLFVEKERSPALAAYVRTDRRFTLAFENARHAVFDLEPHGPTPTE